MIIKNLHLQNIGPFKEAKLNFSRLENGALPVIIITGENGTGKSVIIDSIRTLLLGLTESIERDVTSSDNFLIAADIDLAEHQSLNLLCKSRSDDGRLQTNNYEFNKLFTQSQKSKYEGNYIVNYWSSKLSSDNFRISHIEAPSTKNFLSNSLSGIHTNIEVTKLITFFDYLSDSKDKGEKDLGSKMFELIKMVINSSISDGSLSHISRTKLQPIVSLRNKEISLEKLSSGNLYLIQRLIYLLKQMYSACVNHNIPINEIQNTSGILLIDEAENHLHPKWQKVFLKNILDLFPNLQLIVTTHSPFIVSSIEHSRVFVCEGKDDFSTVNEETDLYSNKPVEEILMSPLFNTSNFNIHIGELIINRKLALEVNDQEKLDLIEKELLEINPSYFQYLNIEELIRSIKK
jgi:predicted ATP-binding protein involved in virulence